jgi:D-3-phosphoglycerate dehydrogenase
VNTSEEVRVLITGSLADEAMGMLEGKIAYRCCEQYVESDRLAAMAAEDGIHGLIVRIGRVTREVLAASPNLKIIVKHGVGVDNIDVEAATELGIPVCITANANYESVAEHALALMFALSKNLFFLDSRMRRGAWEKFSSRSIELYGKCLGLVGVGRIGRRLAELVQPLQMRVVGLDPYLPEARFPRLVRRVGALQEVLREADFLSLHCPKTKDTVGLIGEKEFRLMKSSACIINTARGGIIDEPALVRALQEERILGAGLDCFEKEPVASDHPLLSLGNVILTPHIAGASREAFVRMGIEAVEILSGYLVSGKLDSDVVLNPRVLHSHG